MVDDSPRRSRPYYDPRFSPEFQPGFFAEDQHGDAAPTAHVYVAPDASRNSDSDSNSDPDVASASAHDPELDSERVTATEPATPDAPQAVTAIANVGNADVRNAAAENADIDTAGIAPPRLMEPAWSAAPRSVLNSRPRHGDTEESRDMRRQYDDVRVAIVGHEEVGGSGGAVEVVSSTDAPDAMDMPDAAEGSGLAEPWRNPYLIGLAVVGVGLVGLGVWLFEDAYTAFNEGVAIQTQGDFAAAQVAMYSGPLVMLFGAAIVVGVLFVVAVRWRRRT